MNETIKIVSKMNGKVITVSKGQNKTKPGDLVMQTYTGSPQQQFKLVYIGQYFGFQSMADQKNYIDLKNQSHQIYTKLICYPYNGNLNQKFLLHPINNGFYKIESGLSKLIIEVEGGVDAEDVGVVQNKDYNNLSQMWKLQKV